MKPTVVDFETDKIEGRPKYPPKPVGVAIKDPGKAPRYYGWGHPANNGIYALKAGKAVKVDGDPLKLGTRHLKDAYKGTILGQNIFKFDNDVAETHLAIKPPPWDRVHDTLFTLFLKNPHAPSLSLKPSAEVYLGEPPTERDRVYDWLADRGIIQHPRKKDGKLTYQKDAGAYIAKAPGDLVALYAMGDCTRTEGIQDKLLPDVFKLGMKDAYDRERKLAPILLENERQGMRVDVPRLEKDLKIYEPALVKVDGWLRKKLRAPALNLDSDEDVAIALKKSGQVKDFPKTPTGRDSISKKNLTADYFREPDLWLVLTYRNSLNNVLTQSMRPWLEQALANEGFIFTQWNQVRTDRDKGGARSGRITCSRIQNITKSFTDKGDDYTEEADKRIRKLIGLPELPLVRKYLVGDVGDLFCHRDYNQQEMRLVAHYEDGALAEAYRNDPSTDVHNFVQQLIKRVTGKHYERRPVKIVDFRTVYGGGKAGLAVHLGIPFHEASDLIDDWQAALPDVVELDNDLKGRFRNGEHLRTFGGRVYYCKPAAIAKKGARKGRLVTFEYTALNYLIQPSGADVTKEAIIRFHEHPKRRSRMLNAVHDEINLSAPAKIAKQQNEVLKECMESIKLDVPWKTEGDERPSWGEKAV